MHALSHWQGVRYRTGQDKGHYESWFLRANHPSRKEGFWLRYTIFAPAGQPQKAIGELWAIHFDGESGRIRAGKAELPISACFFSKEGLGVQIGAATFKSGEAQGEVQTPHALRWNLRYEDGGTPLVFLPEHLYTSPFPKAKAVTPRPLVRFAGTLEVDGETVVIDNWVGSENHNWGGKHTDTYAWGQVAGFDNAPDAFLEAITAKLKVGPLWTPPLTILVLRVGQEEYRLNGLARSFGANGSWRYFDWQFDSTLRDVRIHGRIHAQAQDFVGLTYYNPPGGSHTCLNSKIAACELTLERKGREPLQLRTAHRAAFEILTDDTAHGIPVVT
ncbi:MAG: hypothetical protein K0Q68_816 [Moraxellaceae bacterium]|nr:hypothetical protein [Moraxellaceae bacterium]